MSNSGIPILIANIEPFRLILRDKSDVWNVSADQASSGSYDYVKLHRATKFFDANLPKPMPACFAFDGSLILPFIHEFKNSDLIVEEVNRILASIFLGGVRVESISPLDISTGIIHRTGYYRYSQTFSWNSNFHQAISECSAGSLSSSRLIDPEMIAADKIISAYNKGHELLLKLPTLSPSLFLSAFTYHKKHQLRESLAHAWIGIEQIIEHIWKLIVIEDAKSVNIPKRRKFLESQQWNSAHKIEMLYQRGLINEQLYITLSKARLARNSFIHRGLTPSDKEAHSALQSLILLIEVVSKHNQVDFNKANIELFLPNVSQSCISQTDIPKSIRFESKDVVWWQALKAIPGDDSWVGEYESYPDITLSPITQDKDNIGRD